MKKLLFILLLVSNFSFGQISVALSSHAESCAGPFGSIPYTGMTLTSSRLTLLIYVVHSSTTASFGSLSSNNGTTWDVVLQVASGTTKIAIYRAMPSSTVTGEDVTITFTGTERPNGGFTSQILQLDGCQQGGNGANAIKQTVTGNATGADPSLTLATLGQRNAVFAWFGEDANQSGTPESGWTEYFDNACATPFSGYSMGRIDGTDNTPTVTAGSSTWLGAAIELRQSGRRLTLID